MLQGLYMALFPHRNSQTSQLQRQSSASLLRELADCRQWEGFCCIGLSQRSPASQCTTGCCCLACPKPTELLPVIPAALSLPPPLPARYAQLQCCVSALVTISRVNHRTGWFQSTPYCCLCGICLYCVCWSVLCEGGPAALSHALSPIPLLYGLLLHWRLQSFGATHWSCMLCQYTGLCNSVTLYYDVCALSCQLIRGLGTVADFLAYMSCCKYTVPAAEPFPHADN